MGEEEIRRSDKASDIIDTGENMIDLIIKSNFDRIVSVSCSQEEPDKLLFKRDFQTIEELLFKDNLLS